MTNVPSCGSLRLDQWNWTNSSGTNHDPPEKSNLLPQINQLDTNAKKLEDSDDKTNLTEIPVPLNPTTS